MSFRKYKKDFLTKKDKSKKGSVDKNVKKLVNLINSKNDYYTTSSCSGRVVLIKKPGKKQDSEWLFVKHDKIRFDEIKKALEEGRYTGEAQASSSVGVGLRASSAQKGRLKLRNFCCGDTKEQLWFRQEPLIMHICCKTLDDAKRLLNIARKIFKRAGIISLNKKVVIEIIGTGFIYTIIADGKLIVSDDYLKVLIKEANKKIRKNKIEIERFCDLVKCV